MFFAGTDSTAATAMMMIYYCLINPHVVKKLEQEIEEYIKDDENIEQKTLKKMVYLDAIFY